MAQQDQPRASSIEAACTAFAGLIALAIAIGIGRFAFTPILPMMQEDFGVSVSAGGWLAAANYAGYLVGALAAIRLPLRPVTAIRAGLVVIGASTLGMALHQGFVGWLVLRSIAGVASAWVLVFVSAWALERLALLRRSHLDGAVYAGVGTGIVAAGGACLALMRLHASSSDAWITLGVAALAAAAIIWPHLQPRDRA
jgi:MFS family permease